MAVSDHISSQLRLALYDGDDAETGKPVYRYKSFNNVKASADADQLHAVAEAFARLQDRPLIRFDGETNAKLRGAKKPPKREEGGQGRRKMDSFSKMKKAKRLSIHLINQTNRWIQKASMQQWTRLLNRMHSKRQAVISSPKRVRALLRTSSKISN